MTNAIGEKKKFRIFPRKGENIIGWVQFCKGEEEGNFAHRTVGKSTLVGEGVASG